ncbi:hypothetical protein DTO271D3_1279 [Paecilomyces variotii]|nr:hypothetical protein DTO271D3_1279 [Paecilomyces variotii]
MTFRWHESGCRRPEVSTLSGTPCCHYCFALPSLEDAGNNPDIPIAQPPQLGNRAQMGLAWPSVVNYTNETMSSDGEASCYPQSQMSGEEGLGKNNGQDQGSFPALKSPTRTSPETLSHGDIRLLRLRPAPADDPIHADIEVVHLQDPLLPRYEALSYTWSDDSGDSDRSCPVFLGEYWDITYVTHNCEQALRAIRDHQVDRLIWIDSLCINQTCLDEKSHQVGLIREIFSKASKVIAYLGGESPESSTALRFLRETSIAGPITSEITTVIDRDLRKCLRVLFQRPYFTRLWAVQEVLLAKDLEIVSGRHSASWPKWLSKFVDLSLQVPPWLFRDESWYGFTGQDLLRILLKTSSYECSDPRDRVFAVLGLIYENDITADYRLPVESIYTGITAYIIKNCKMMDVLALTGTNKRTFNTPSWVPDWSQKSVHVFPNNLLGPEGEFLAEDGILQLSTRVMFHGIVDCNQETQISADTGSMRICAVKLCDITGMVCNRKDYTYIVMQIGQRGTFIITLPGPRYEISTDAVFLLSGWDHPVILRYHADSDTYSLVSPCILSFGPPPSRTWFSPWELKTSYSRQDGIQVSAFVPEEHDLLLEFHSRLQELCSIPTSLTSQQDTSPCLSTITNSTLSFFLLSLTSLRDIETRLRKAWDQSNRRMRWMFHDQAATWKLMQEMSRGHVDRLSGEGEIRLEKSESVCLAKYCSFEFPTTYHWDLRRFCWSFLRPPVPDLAATEHVWSPVFDELNSQLREIRIWTKATEQLLQVFEFTQRVLGDDWIVYPGNGLRRKWLDNYQNFQHVMGGAMQSQAQPTVHIDASCLWDWEEFETHLRARERLWDQKVPRELDPSINSNIAAIIGLKSLGLDFYNKRTVRIR